MSRQFNPTDNQLVFEKTLHGTYIHHLRPSALTPGLQVEVRRVGKEWHGSYTTFRQVQSCDCKSTQECPYHGSKAVHIDEPPCALAPKQDVPSLRSTITADKFPALIYAMKRIFDAMPEAKEQVNMRDVAAISVACEAVWRFPKELLTEIAETPHTP